MIGVAEFKQVGGLIAEVLNAIAQSDDGKAPLVEAAVKEKVKALTDRFPIYQCRRFACLPILKTMDYLANEVPF